MASYEALSSIAHDIAQALTQPSHAEDRYLLSDLLGHARSTGQPRLQVDVLTGEARPEALVSRPLAQALARHARAFPDLVAGHDGDLQCVKAARMELTFDLAVERPAGNASGRSESPYVCRVEIDDDRGKTWRADTSGWSIAGRTRAGLLSRLLGHV